MEASTPRWVVILILMLLALCAALLLLASLGTGMLSIVSLILASSDSASSMIVSLSFAFQGVVLAVIAWPLIQKLNDSPGAEQPLRLPFAPWQIAAGIILTLAALGLGAAVTRRHEAVLDWLILPALTLAAILPPVWVLLGIGTNKLDLGPRWRAAGIFGIAATLGPLIMIVLEILLILLVAAGVMIFLSGQPDRMQELISLAEILQTESDPQAVFELLGPYLYNPAVIAAVLTYISVAVPLIEELLKPLGVWLFLRRIDTPARGFTLGLVCGAAYAMVESLGASAQGGESWLVVAGARAGTSLLHVFTTGLMGWAIVPAARGRRVLRLLGAYAAAVLIHGIWNACASGAAFVQAGQEAGEWSATLLPALIGGMILLAAGMFFLLFVFNRAVRLQDPPGPAQPAEAARTGQGVQ